MGNLEVGSSNGDSEKRMKGALGMGLLSLSEGASMEGALRGLIHWEP